MDKNNNIELEVIKIMAEIRSVEHDLIKTDLSFDELELDSIQFVRLVIQCEKDLKINFEDEMLLQNKFSNVEEFIRYIKKRCETISDHV